MRVFLSGISCVGKTTVGSKLAGLLGCRFFDLDHEVEKFHGLSIERLQRKFLTQDGFREEAAKALSHLLAKPESRECVIALPPSGLMGPYWKVVKKAGGKAVVLSDDPGNILDRIIFYDIDAQEIEKELTAKEMRFYLSEIKADAAYFGRTYKRAQFHVDITGLDADQAAEKVAALVLPSFRDADAPGSSGLRVIQG